MKRLICALLMCFMMLFASAQELSFKATYFKIRETNKAWSTWSNTNIPVQFNSSLRRIIVFTETTQVISYGQLSSISDPKYDTLYGHALMNGHENIYIYIIIYKDGDVYLDIQYDDIEYTYKLVPAD